MRLYNFLILIFTIVISNLFSMPPHIEHNSERLLHILEQPYNFKNQKWGELKGAKNTYSQRDIQKYNGSLNIENTTKVLNKMLALGEFFIKRHDENNLKLILESLLSIEDVLHIRGDYETYAMYYFFECSLTYDEFKNKTKDICNLYFNQLLMLYCKKNSKKQKELLYKSLYQP